MKKRNGVENEYYSSSKTDNSKTKTLDKKAKPFLYTIKTAGVKVPAVLSWRYDRLRSTYLFGNCFVKEKVYIMYIYIFLEGSHSGIERTGDNRKRPQRKKVHTN